MKRRNDGRWLRVVTINGKKHYFYSYADTESKADKDIRRQILEYKENKKGGECFADVVSRWETVAYENVEHGTIKKYKPSARELVSWFGKTPCADITSTEIYDYLNSLANNGFSLKTIKGRKSVLNLIMTYALYDEKIITSNPVPGTPMPKPKKNKRIAKPKERRALTEREVLFVKENKNNGYWGKFAFFCLVTGCRSGEAFAVKYRDIDLENKVLNICRTIEHHGNTGYIKDHTKTEAGMRVVPMTDDLIEIITKEKHKKDDLIFPDPKKGGIITNDHKTKGWNSFRNDTEISDVTPHYLRHTYATMLYDADVDVKTAMYLLGHKDISTTLKIYTHLSKNRLVKGNKKTIEMLNMVFQ
jgi:integrase